MEQSAINKRARKRKAARWKWLTAIGMVVIAVVAVAIHRSRRPEIIPVTIREVSLRKITSTVSATGKIFPVVEVKISSEVAGEIVELAVREGQRVVRGDLLARVNPITLESQVRREEAAIRTARARAEQTRISMEQARRDMERLTDLRESDFISADELERAQTRWKEQQASYEAALAQIEEREMQLHEAKDLLDKATIYSPMDGTVSVMSAELGERVVGTGQFQGTEIMRVADLDNMEVRIEVSETDIVNVQRGNPVKVQVDAIPDEEFRGEVTEIASSARIQGERSQEQSTTFEVRITIQQLDPRMRPGMTATADIETKTVEGVVAVPLQSVTVRDRNAVAEALGEEKPDEERMAAGGPGSEGAPGERPGRGFDRREARERLQRIVWVVEDGKARMRKVETGIADNAFIEIKSGVNAGETVVSGSYSAISRQLKHESAIEIETPNGGNERKREG